MVKQGVYINPTLVQGWLGNTERWRDQMTLAQQLVKDPNLALCRPIKATWIREPTHVAAIGADASIAEFLKSHSEAGRKIHRRRPIQAWSRGSIPGLSLHYEMQISPIWASRR